MFELTGSTKHCELKQTKDWCEMALANTSKRTGNGRSGQEKAGAASAGNYTPCIRRKGSKAVTNWEPANTASPLGVLGLPPGCL